MLELHTRQVYTVDATAIKRARKNEKEQFRGDKAEVPPVVALWSKSVRPGDVKDLKL